MNRDEYYMKRCLDLAKLGGPYVRSNPMVGSVIVFNNEIIGEGFHQLFGGPHAEVNAINAVKNEEWLKKSVLYVNLEPCSHFGKTPPCSDLIIEKGIPEVVIGIVDPSTKVSGKGVENLRNAGVKVKTNVLEEECRWLNRAFITYHTKKRPYVVLKWAQTRDGFIDKIRSKNDPIGPNWITNNSCRVLVHQWRTIFQTIMVGTNTILKDDPQLDARLWPGESPVRIAPDRNNRLNNKMLNIFNQEKETLVFSNRPGKKLKNLEYINISDNENGVDGIIEGIYNKGYTTLFVEGGQELISAFIREGYWDEARVFTGNLIFGEGIRAPLLKKYSRVDRSIFDDTNLDIYYR